MPPFNRNKPIDQTSEFKGDPFPDKRGVKTLARNLKGRRRVVKRSINDARRHVQLQVVLRNFAFSFPRSFRSDKYKHLKRKHGINNQMKTAGEALP